MKQRNRQVPNNQNRKKKASDKRARHSVISLVILLVLLVGAIAFTVYAYHRYNQLHDIQASLTYLEPEGPRETTPEGEIAQNIRYKSAKLGGKTFEEAEQTLKNSEKPLLNNLGTISFVYEDEGKDKKIKMSPYELGLRLDTEKILEEAKTESKKLFGRKPILEDEYRVDEEAFKAGIEKLKSEVNRPSVDSEPLDYDFATGDFVYSEPKDGLSLVEESAINAIRKALETEDYSAKINLDVEVIKATKIEANVSQTTNLIASASTPIVTYSEGRNLNIMVAAERINGTIIPAGGSFSYHNTIGPMTEANGFVPAGIQDDYGNDGEGVGGGLCQPSTTLYIAAVRANMRIDAHHFHTQPINYSPIGTDCMVADWADFVFTNTTGNTVVIGATFDGATLTFSFYGTPSTEYAYIDLYVESLEEEELEEEPVKEHKEELAPYTTEVKVPPRPSRHVKVYRNYYDVNGGILKQDLMYDHVYPGFRGVVYVNEPEQAQESTSGTSEAPGEVVYYDDTGEAVNEPAEAPVSPSPATPPPIAP